jgi:DNA integrity scanning protein DisA with diadenylate cyclase activity
MDNEALHFQHQLEKFEDIIWDARQNFRTFQEYRDDIRAAWNDSAAREINQRFLHPNSEDSSNYLKELSYQLQLLTSISEKVREVSQLFAEANQLSQQIDQLKITISEEMNLAAANHDQSKDNFSRAESAIQITKALINRANSSC